MADSLKTYLKYHPRTRRGGELISDIVYPLTSTILQSGLVPFSGSIARSVGSLKSATDYIFQPPYASLQTQLASYRTSKQALELQLILSRNEVHQLRRAIEDWEQKDQDRDAELKLKLEREHEIHVIREEETKASMQAAQRLHEIHDMEQTYKYRISLEEISNLHTQLSMLHSENERLKSLILTMGKIITTTESELTQAPSTPPNLTTEEVISTPAKHRDEDEECGEAEESWADIGILTPQSMTSKDANATDVRGLQEAVDSGSDISSSESSANSSVNEELNHAAPVPGPSEDSSPSPTRPASMNLHPVIDVIPSETEDTPVDPVPITRNEDLDVHAPDEAVLSPPMTPNLPEQFDYTKFPLPETVDPVAGEEDVAEDIVPPVSPENHNSLDGPTSQGEIQLHIPSQEPTARDHDDEEKEEVEKIITPTDDDGTTSPVLEQTDLSLDTLVQPPVHPDLKEPESSPKLEDINGPQVHVIPEPESNLEALPVSDISTVLPPKEALTPEAAPSSEPEQAVKTVTPVQSKEDLLPKISVVSEDGLLNHHLVEPTNLSIPGQSPKATSLSPEAEHTRKHVRTLSAAGSINSLRKKHFDLHLFSGKHDDDGKSTRKRSRVFSSPSNPRASSSADREADAASTSSRDSGSNDLGQSILLRPSTPSKLGRRHSRFERYVVEPIEHAYHKLRRDDSDERHHHHHGKEHSGSGAESKSSSPEQSPLAFRGGLSAL